MKVINFYGGPGVGKSTIAAELFVHFKKKQRNVELVTEYAKDMVWEERNNILDDQLYILAKTNRKFIRLLNKGIEFAITDSPILMQMVYVKSHELYLKNTIRRVSEQYDNINFFLLRDPDLKYNSCGRIQNNLEEAIEKDAQILEILSRYQHHVIDVSDYKIEDIAMITESYL